MINFSGQAHKAMHQNKRLRPSGGGGGGGGCGRVVVVFCVELHGLRLVQLMRVRVTADAIENCMTASKLVRTEST